MTFVHGALVRFLSHGPDGEAYIVSKRTGDDCDLIDHRARTLRSVPAEMLVEAPLPIREVDGMR